MMRRQLIGTIAMAAPLLLAFSLRLPAQSSTANGTGMQHDISGVWMAAPGGAQATDEYGNPVPRPAAAQPAAGQPRAAAAGGGANAGYPPFTPEGQKRFEANTAEEKNDRPITINPVFTCHPPGIPHDYFNGIYPVEIVQTPQRMFMFFESSHQWREIWMDGRKIPDDIDPTYNGYSVGHWDGDDLVVESGDFNDVAWLDGNGHPRSTAMKLTERFHRAGQNNLRISVTIDDPKTYVRPFTRVTNYNLKPTWDIGESFCVPEDQSNFEKHVLTPNSKPTPVTP
jgi:hypothetical protein